MDIRHFILTNDGAIREFSAEDALGIANGSESVPALAASRVRYLQVLVDPGDDDVTIRTAGTLIRFDETGHFAGVGVDDPITSPAGAPDSATEQAPESVAEAAIPANIDVTNFEDDEAITGITAFEHDACVEFALKRDMPGRVTHH